MDEGAVSRLRARTEYCRDDIMIDVREQDVAGE